MIKTCVYLRVGSNYKTEPMTLDEIKNIQDFQTFLFEQKDENFIKPDNSEYSSTICGTSFQSEILYVLPATENLENIQFYNNLKFVTINNYKVDRKKIEILKNYKDKLTNVTHLHIWNIKQNDLDLLELFPNVTHLLISYIGKADFSYKGLDYLNKLETIVLSSVNKIIDFNFLTTSQKEKIKHLHLTYTASLTKFDGIEDFQNLETLTLFASTMESRKTVNIENLNGLEKLSNLRSFEIDYFKFDMDVLKAKLKQLKKLKQYKIKNETYENI